MTPIDKAIEALEEIEHCAYRLAKECGRLVGDPAKENFKTIREALRGMQSETLKSDIETYIKISSDQANVIEALQNLAQKAKDKGFKVEPETILFLIEEKS